MALFKMQWDCLFLIIFTRVNFTLQKTSTPNQTSILRTYYTYLSYLDTSDEGIAKLDLQAFKKDIQQGLSFDSTIPQGFGVGSKWRTLSQLFTTNMRYIK